MCVDGDFRIRKRLQIFPSYFRTKGSRLGIPVRLSQHLFNTNPNLWLFSIADTETAVDEGAVDGVGHLTQGGKNFSRKVLLEMTSA